MTSFYCEECGRNIDLTTSIGCEHIRVNKPKRKSFEFEGDYYSNNLYVSKIDEQIHCFNTNFSDYCYPTKEAAEKARQELIKLNEEIT